MEKKKCPPAGTKCAVCGAVLQHFKEHDWAKIRRSGVAYICPDCVRKKVNRDG